MFENLQKIAERYMTLQEMLKSIDASQDYKKLAEIQKELNSIKDIAEIYMKYRELQKQKDDLINMLSEEHDIQMKKLTEEELEIIEKKIEECEKNIKEIMEKKMDEGDTNSIIIEIRAGAGGEEAALFAADLFRMYLKFAEKRNFKVEVLSKNETGLGGFKEIIALISGKGAYRSFKYESGVHRVQRIPITESGGRIHTSTVTVAVLPEAKEEEIEINPKDLKIETFRASGPGGQHVNVTESAVRITYLPKNITVVCQDERSQHKNRMRAMQILRARLKKIMEEEKKSLIDTMRKSQVGTGERAEKIRTYNFPQNRVTDHRIKLTLKKLDRVLNGELDEIIENLRKNDEFG